MKIKFSWLTLAGTEEAYYNLEDLSKECLINLVKFMFSNIPNNRYKDIAFTLNDYFLSKFNVGIMDSIANITQQDLEDVVDVIVNRKGMVSVAPMEEMKNLQRKITIH